MVLSVKFGLFYSVFSVSLQSGSIIPMPVPSSYNDITETSALRDFIGWAWYDKEFYVPHGWYSNSTTRIVLRFESAHYYTIVVSFICKTERSKYFKHKNTSVGGFVASRQRTQMQDLLVMSQHF